MYKYLHILNDIENMIQNGEIREGKKLPSIRSPLRNTNVIRQQLYVLFMN